MSKSIISNIKECFICGSIQNLNKHHIFFGTANRKLSEEDGCWVYLCTNHHTMTNHSVHRNIDVDLDLKRKCQKEWESLYGDREKFIERYGKSYL